jgi:tungstate transport system ATP-binding protein
MSLAYQLCNIRFDYGEKTALSLPELSIDAGKATALVGPNGCGKSTLLNLLAFVEKPNLGRILFFGELARPEKWFSFRQRIGYLPQKPYMLHGTVLDNLNLALKLRDIPKKLWQNRIDTILERLNIAHLKNHKAASLSGGELQKAALARTLVTDPKVLLLDEPFSYLDQASNQLLARVISECLKEMQATLVFSTHDRLQALALADEVISLVGGEQIKSPLINLYHGVCKQHVFSTGKIDIILTADIVDCQHVSVDPHEIVLSRQPLVSSIRNQFQGKVLAIAEEMGKVRVAVDAGEIFQALITYEALNDLKIQLGDKVWVSFKSNSVVAF